MFLKFLKFVIGFVVFMAFVLLFAITFWNTQTNKTDKGLQIKTLLNNSGSLGVNAINSFDSIYSNKKNNYKIIKKENNIYIKLSSGVFILSLNDLTKHYNITSDDFSFDLKIPGDIYIDNSGSKKVIFSLNSSFFLNFLDKSSKKINSIFIYPHESFVFNPNAYKSYYNVDVFRLKTLNYSRFAPYLGNSLKDNKKDNLTFFIKKENTKLIEKFVSDKITQIKQNNKNSDILEKEKIVDFPFKNFIIKNEMFFINDSKKNILLQNQIFNNLILLFNDNYFNKTRIEKINELLGELRNKNKGDFENTMKFIKKIYYVVLFQNNIINNTKLQNFLYLLENKNNSAFNFNYLQLKQIYFAYDYKGLNNFLKNYQKFLDGYISKSGIIKKDKDYLLNEKEKLDEVEAFVFYLKEFINAYLFKNGIKDLKYENIILSKYLSLNKMIYFSNNDIKKIETSLVENIKLYKKIEKYISSNYFDKKRDESGLLIEKIDGSINENEILKLKDNTDTIISLYNKYKNKIHNKKEFLDEYNNVFSKLEEEFLALTDRDNYIKKYNKSFGNLYNTDGVGKIGEKIYTIEDIYNYFKQFNGINFSKTNINLKQRNIYEIKNILINGINYSFVVYPNIGYRIDIYKEAEINNKDKGFIGTYKLEEKKRLLDEKLKGASNEERYKYDFKNYFLNKFKKATFIESESNNSKCGKDEIFINELKALGKDIYCLKKQNNDIGIVVNFKQNKLIGQEFNILKDFFHIKYYNIFLIQKGKDYDISLKNIITNINIKNKSGQESKYKVIFSSDYDYKNHNFYNLKLRIINMNYDSRLLFGGSIIKFSPFTKVKITNLKQFLQKYLQNIQIKKNIYSIIRQEMIIDNIEIYEYFVSSLFKFSINNNSIKVKIKLEKNKINSIIVNDSNIIDTPINIGELKNYISKIK